MKMREQFAMRRRSIVLAALSGISMAICYFVLTVAREDADSYVSELGFSSVLLILLA